MKKLFTNDKKETHILSVRVYGSEHDLKMFQAYITEYVNIGGIQR